MDEQNSNIDNSQGFTNRNAEQANQQNPQMQQNNGYKGNIQENNQNLVQGTQGESSGNDISEKRKEIILRKKRRVQKMREFLVLKKKIELFLKQYKIEDAKDTYNGLYRVYQEIYQISTSSERESLQKDLANIYNSLLTTISHKKGVRHVEFHQKEDPDRVKSNQDAVKKRKVVTTDFDVVVQTVEEKGSMSLGEIQSRFNIPRRLAEEWIQILADYGVVEIKYLPVGGLEVVRVHGNKKK